MARKSEEFNEIGKLPPDSNDLVTQKAIEKKSLGVA